MKFLARWLFRLLVLALALAVALLLLRDHLLEEYLEAHGQRLTGLEVRIGRVESGLLRPELHLEDVRVYDPPEFGGGPFLTAREVHLEYDPAALARGSLRLRLLRAHVAELVVTEDSQGGQNLRTLAARGLLRDAPAAPWPLQWEGVETVNLTVDRVRRVNPWQPARNLSLDPGVRQAVFKSVCTVQDLWLIWAHLAGRPTVAAILHPGGATNQSPAAARDAAPLKPK